MEAQQEETENLFLRLFPERARPPPRFNFDTDEGEGREKHNSDSEDESNANDSQEEEDVSDVLGDVSLEFQSLSQLDNGQAAEQRAAFFVNIQEAARAARSRAQEAIVQKRRLLRRSNFEPPQPVFSKDFLAQYGDGNRLPPLLLETFLPFYNAKQKELHAVHKSTRDKRIWKKWPLNPRKEPSSNPYHKSQPVSWLMHRFLPSGLSLLHTGTYMYI